jgi:hypothetical protein
MSDSKGLSINIIGLGTPSVSVQINQGETVGTALAKANVDATGMDIRANAEVATPDTPLNEDAVVTTMPHVEGGC